MNKNGNRPLRSGRFAEFTKGSAGPRVGEKRPPVGADGRCPACGQAVGYWGCYSTLTCGLRRLAAGWMISSCKAQTSASTRSGDPLPR